MEKKLNVAVYLRLSNEDNDKANIYEYSESIKNQKNMLLDKIDKTDNWKLYKVYCDEDLSGAGSYREEFENMIEDCKNGYVDIVLCKSQSRFSRDIEIVEKYLHNKFIEWNVRFIGLVDNVDTDNIYTKKSRQINSLVNEWYLEEVSNNIRSAFKIKMQKGEFISPFAPYGYRVDGENNNKLEVDSYASNIIKKIYQLYINGYGYSKIADYLNNNFISPPSLYKRENGYKINIVSTKDIEEIKWSSSSVKSILTNEIYTGVLIQGKRTTSSYKNKKIIKKDKKFWIKKYDTHEAIISKKIFIKVQKLRFDRGKVNTKNKKVSIFSRKIKCKNCGNYMNKNSTNKYTYLTCRNKYCTYNNSIRYDYLYDVVEKIIFLKYSPSSLINDVENDLLMDKSKEKNRILNKIEILNDKFKSIYDDKLNNIITFEQFNLLNDNYTNKLLIYNERLEHLQKSKVKKIDVDEITNKLNRSIIEKLIKYIVVDKFENNYNIICYWK